MIKFWEQQPGKASPETQASLKLCRISPGVSYKITVRPWGPFMLSNTVYFITLSQSSSLYWLITEVNGIWALLVKSLRKLFSPKERRYSKLILWAQNRKAHPAQQRKPLSKPCLSPELAPESQPCQKSFPMEKSKENTIQISSVCAGRSEVTWGTTFVPKETSFPGLSGVVFVSNDESCSWY